MIFSSNVHQYVYPVNTSIAAVQDFFGKSDPYLEFARQNPDGTYSAVHRIPVSLVTVLIL